MIKKCLSFLLAGLCSANFLFAQLGSNPSYVTGKNTPSPQDGNGTLGATYNFSKCGLNYVTASQKLGQRFINSCCPAVNGLIQPAAFNVSGIPGAALIEKVFLWFDISGTGAAVTVTITNPASQTFNLNATLIGSCQDKCWGYQGSYSYRVDITSAISGNGNYTISGIPAGNPQNDVDGATMMIVYSDNSVNYRGDIIIFDGCDVQVGGNANETVNGFNACSASSNAKAFLIVGDLQQIGTTMVLNSS